MSTAKIFVRVFLHLNKKAKVQLVNLFGLLTKSTFIVEMFQGKFSYLASQYCLHCTPMQDHKGLGEFVRVAATRVRCL